MVRRLYQDAAYDATKATVMAVRKLGAREAKAKLAGMGTSKKPAKKAGKHGK